MSAFLGPIHYWLYNKINIQNNLVNDILSFASNEYNLSDLSATLDREFGYLETTKPLEEIIDTSNIHGWLQECVSIVEYRLANAVTTILNHDSNALDQLKTIYKIAGTEISTLSQDSGVGAIYQYLNDTLLDGMPCDHANMLISQEENEIIFKRNLCVHENYWNEVGGDIKNYYLLREELIKGLLSKTKATFIKLDNTTSKITIE